MNHRHEALSVKSPPSNGPTTLATPNTAPIRTWSSGLFFRGTTTIMSTIAPFIMPGLPSPATARPVMNTEELEAAPQIADPASKIVMAMRRVDLGKLKGFDRHDVDDSV